MEIALGVDGGGTKTISVVLDETGAELGRGKSGPSNQYNVGIERMTESVREAVEAALAAAGLPLSAVGAMCLSMAGADRPEDCAAIEAAVRRAFNVPYMRVCNDALGALVGGIGRPYGVVVIAGTGSIAYGINARGEEQRAGGWGHIIGDEGSAYQIGQSAMRAVVRAYDGRGKPTRLAEALCAHVGVERVEQLIGLFFDRHYGVAEIAALAPAVSQAAREGDALAHSILTEAGRELGLVATAVIRGLGMEQDEFEVVMVGGVFQAREVLMQPFREAIAVVAPRATFIWPRHDPATGAALLALQALG